MAHFPFFVDISGKPGLIIGGGKIALRKIEKLLPYGPSLTICAPDFLPELQALAALSSSPAIFTKASASDAAAISTAETAAAPTLQLLHRPFGEDLLEPAPVFVIAATDDRALNRRIATLCKEKSIPLYVTALSDRAVDLREADLSKAAMVIGSEGRGVGEFFLTHADRELIIPMSARCESLNAAIAAAIVMWEMKR